MWQEKDNSLFRKFEFKDFDEAIIFINKVADIARRLNHHPTLTNTYNTVELRLSTHDAGYKVTEKDREFAREVDKLGKAKSEVDTTGVGIQIDKAKLFTD